MNAAFPITQPYANDNPIEPACWYYADTSIYYPGQTNGHRHNGIDYGCPIGTIIRVPRAGTVARAGWDLTGFGNLVTVNVGGHTLWFGHLSAIDVTVGQALAAGARIGLSGSTGNSTGPHLHGGVSDNQTLHFVNPGQFGDSLLPLFPGDLVPPPYPHLTSAQSLKQQPSVGSADVQNAHVPADQRIAIESGKIHNAEGDWYKIGWGHGGIFFQGYVKAAFVAQA